MTDWILHRPAPDAAVDSKHPPATRWRAWIIGFLVIAAAFAWPFVRHFPDAQVSVLARNIADSCLLEHVLQRVSVTGERFLDWKLTQAPYVFPDYPLVAALSSVCGYGSASAVYPLFFCVLATVGWGFYFARAGAAPSAIAFLVAVVFGMLWFDNSQVSPAMTYVYLFLPGHHAAFTLLAPAIFAATERAIDPRGGPSLWWGLGTFALLSGLAAMGDPLSLFMFVGPAAAIAIVLATLRMIPWRRAVMLLAACAIAYGIGQGYQQVALYPTGRHYAQRLLAPVLSGPSGMVEAAMKTSVPTFLRDLREYYFNFAKTGIWFLLPVTGWLLAGGVVARRLFGRGPTAEEGWTATDRLVFVPASSLLLGLPVTVLLQVLLVGYSGPAHSRQFVAFLLLGIVVFLLIAGRAVARLRDRNPAQYVWIDLAAASILVAIVAGFALRVTSDVVTRRNVWTAIAERADAIHALAREAGVRRVMTGYWLAAPLSLRHPDLEVDFCGDDLVYLEPRVRDPAIYRNGAIEAYAVEPLGLTEARLVQLFGPPEKTFTRTTDAGEILKLLIFSGDKPRTYNQWVTSYSPAIHGKRAIFPAATLAFLQPPQHGPSSYRLSPDAAAPVVRAAHTLISLWPGGFRHVYRFSGSCRPKRVLVTLFTNDESLLDAEEVPVDAVTGEATIDLTASPKVDPQVLGELIVDVPVDPRPADGEAYVFEGLTIERR
jgi:hypothetical protein